MTAGASTDETRIANSVFFDAAYYCRQLAEPLDAGTSPAAHYLTRGWFQGLDPGPLFSTRCYFWRNPDVQKAGVNPLLHYLQFGLAEGRRAWSSAEAMRWQQPWFANPHRAIDETELNKGRWPRLKVGDAALIYAHSQGHFVFRQFQTMLVQAFQAIGIKAFAADEITPAQLVKPAISLVIAPHDFFYLPGAPDASDPAFAEAVLINTEQMPSRWFARIMPLLFNASHVLDMNVQTAASICRLGINARFLPMGFLAQSEIFRASHEEQPRDIDLLWIGSNSKRRHDWFGQHQVSLCRHKLFVRLVGVVGALNEKNPDAISPLQYAALARRTKIHLNIHHFNMPYFEWQRIMHYGLMQGNCVVTETSPRVPGLQPGVHYLEANKDRIPDLVDWLLSSDEGQQKLVQVSKAGREAAIKVYNLSQTLASLFSVPMVSGKS